MPTTVTITQFGEIVNRDPGAVEGPYTIQAPANPWDGFVFSVRSLSLSDAELTFDANGKGVWDPSLGSEVATAQFTLGGGVVTFQFNAGLGTAGVWLRHNADNTFGFFEQKTLADILDVPATWTLITGLTATISLRALLFVEVRLNWTHPGSGNRKMDIGVEMRVNGVAVGNEYRRADSRSAGEDFSDTILFPLPAAIVAGNSVELYAQNSDQGTLDILTGSGFTVVTV